MVFWSFLMTPHNLCVVLRTFQKHPLKEVATSSLGQGLGVACGMAYTGKYFDKSR